MKTYSAASRIFSGISLKSSKRALFAVSGISRCAGGPELSFGGRVGKSFSVSCPTASRRSAFSADIGRIGSPDIDISIFFAMNGVPPSFVRFFAAVSSVSGRFSAFSGACPVTETSLSPQRIVSIDGSPTANDALISVSRRLFSMRFV